jgi:hypothetical protein
MKHIRVANILKVFSIITAIVGGLFFFWYIPLLVEETVIENDITWLRVPALTGIWIIALLCYISLYFFWKICQQIGKDNSFCQENAHSMKGIGYCAIIACILIVGGDVFLASFGYLNGATIVFSFFLVFVGSGIAVICLSLTQLIYQAFEIKEENDLTV